MLMPYQVSNGCIMTDRPVSAVRFVAGSSTRQPVQPGCHLLDDQAHHVDPFKERSQTPI